jgi:hypothetical protein
MALPLRSPALVVGETVHDGLIISDLRGIALARFGDDRVRRPPTERSHRKGDLSATAASNVTGAAKAAGRTTEVEEECSPRRSSFPPAARPIDLGRLAQDKRNDQVPLTGPSGPPGTPGPRFPTDRSSAPDVVSKDT